MNTRTMFTRNMFTSATLAAVVAIAFAAGGDASQGDTTMTDTVRGSFDVTVEPVHQETLHDGNRVGRFTLTKQYHGDLEASGKGEMLTGTTSVKGAAAYVAIEHVDGTLGGRRGTFLLQHKGTMAHGEQELEITVVPESGTGELAGLTGTAGIEIADDGKHFYTLEYTLAEQPAARDDDKSDH